MLFRISHQNTPIRTLKQNLELGETILHEFKKEFPALRSNSFLKLKISQHGDSRYYQEIMPKIEVLAAKYMKKIIKMRIKLNVYHASFSAYIKKLRKIMQKQNIANCSENANIMLHELQKKGEKPYRIKIKIFDVLAGVVDNSNHSRNISKTRKIRKISKIRKVRRTKPWGDHSFVVFGLKKGASAKRPNTWGQEAVIVDPWCNIVMKASDAMEYLKQQFGFDPKHQEIDCKGISPKMFERRLRLNKRDQSASKK